MRLPQITKFSIENYEMFPGREGQNRWAEDFSQGVYVIAGVNGLGKTTFLNILLRGIIGPFDPKKQTGTNTPSHELGNWRNKTFFSERVSDGAYDAHVTIGLSVGATEYFITRRLKDLKISSILKDGNELQPTQETYRKEIVSACGLTSFFDFQYLIRNMVFFLEDRNSLIWNDASLFEILRILYAESGEAHKLGVLYDQILDLDSNYRNLNWQFNRRKKEYERKRVYLEDSSKTMSDYESNIRQYEALDKEIEELDQQIRDYLVSRDSTHRQLQQRRQEYLSLKEHAEVAALRWIAPSVELQPSNITYLLASMISGDTCLVCGTEEQGLANRLWNKLSAGICPVCENEKQYMQNPRSSEDLAIVNQRFEEAQKRHSEAGKLATELEHLENELKRLRNTHDQKLAERNEYGKQIEKISKNIPDNAESIKTEKDALDYTEMQLSKISSELDGKKYEYAQYLDNARRNLESRIEEIRARFRRYAKTFLAEECDLEYRIDKRAIGQSGKRYGFPTFRVRMTSGVFQDTPTVRSGGEEVSESQNEFIELAFRMAILASVCDEDTGVMLILETPEASLDAVFTEEAAKLLGDFAYNSGAKNTVIATSNLTSGHMIEELLAANPRDRRKFAINLIDIAQPTRAVRNFYDRYQKEFLESVQRAEAKDG